MCEISMPQDSLNIYIQMLYQLLIFLIFLFDAFFLIDDKTFDKNKKLLLLPEKFKLIYVNGIFGCLVNIISILYLIQQKCKEKAETSLNDFHEV